MDDYDSNEESATNIQKDDDLYIRHSKSQVLYTVGMATHDFFLMEVFYMYLQKENLVHQFLCVHPLPFVSSSLPDLFLRWNGCMTNTFGRSSSSAEHVD